MGLLDGIFGQKNREVTVDEVMDVLEEIQISPHQVKTEKNVETIIVEALRKVFDGVHGHLGLKSDIDIGNGEVGIELKLASALQGSAAAVQRLFGQAIFYSKRCYNEDLLVVIVGAPKFKKEPSMNEIMDFLEDIGINVLFIETGKKNKD